MRLAGLQRAGWSGLLVDMGGVLFHGDRALPGVARFIAAIADKPHCFVTNNPIRTPGAVVAHFVRLGLPAPRPAQMVISHLVAELAGALEVGQQHLPLCAGVLRQLVTLRTNQDYS